QTPSYFNNFSCIPAEVQFRPERLAEKTRLDGTLNATVDAAGDGQYAEIDDQGRYKVKLPFDQGDAAEGKASRWVRMAQPYAGADYGMHFPLHKGTEVLLTFVDGDPDRPIIAGAVPNPETATPVKGGNQTQSMIRTGGGNQIRIEDGEGGQQIHMSSPTSNSIISLGDVNAGNIFLSSDGTWVSNIGDNATEEIGGDKKTEISGDEEKVIGVNQGICVDGNQDTLVKGNQDLRVNGNRTVTVVGSEKKDVQGNDFCQVDGFKKKMTVGATEEIFVGVKATQNLAATSEITAGLKQASLLGYEVVLNASGKYERNAAQKIAEITSKKEIVGDYEMDATSTIDFKGGAGITIKSGSKITLIAPGIVLDGDVTIKENLIVEDDVSMKRNLKVHKKFKADNTTSD
ncbi:MAG: type VI secretion system tip protein VgrG, partial [Candidatus Electrothrix sp. ATG2]|nr:type VI secretion system tip protein VgrG [Candidatus Electrothrix sp. ATG2]